MKHKIIGIIVVMIRAIDPGIALERTFFINPPLILVGFGCKANNTEGIPITHVSKINKF